MDLNYHTDQSGQAESQNFTGSQDDQDAPAYPWMRHEGWMQQAQPIPLEQFPRATAPTIYEGYIPAAGQATTYFPTEFQAPQFPWPPQKPPPPLKHPITYGESLQANTAAFPAYQNHASVNASSSRSQFSSFTSRTALPSLRASPFNPQSGTRVRYPSIARAQTPSQQVHLHSASLPSSNVYNGQQYAGSYASGSSQRPLIDPALHQQPSSTHLGYPVEPLYAFNSSVQPLLGGFSQVDQALVDDFGRTEEQSDADEDDEELPEEGYGMMQGVDSVGAVHGMDQNVQRLPEIPSAQKEKPEKPSGRGRRRGRKGKKDPRSGTRQVLDPGEDFNKLHGEATECFLMGDLPKARELILTAIALNPEIYSAHVMLSEIYFTLNEPEKAIAAIFSGAHAAPNDPSVWLQTADTCLQRSTAGRIDTLKQAAYCFTRLLSIDQEDHDARFQKAVINRELGHHAKALKDLSVILKAMPYNPSILKEYAEVCLDVNQIKRARDLYEEALDVLRSGLVTDTEAFSWGHLIAYVDLISRDEGLDRAIVVLKEIARWLTGRAGETYWNDVVDDDREWDLEDMPRRTDVPEFRPGLHSFETYGASLPLELRVKLGDLRLTQGKIEEAHAHFEWLEPEALAEGDKIFDYPDLFVQVGHSLREAKEYRQALRYYDALRKVNVEFDGDDGANFWLGIAACSYIGGAKENALEYYENVKAIDPSNVEALTQLSKLYADKGLRASAIKSARNALELHEKSLPKTERRRYERKEWREARKDALQALYIALAIPRKHSGKTPEPVPSYAKSRREKAKRKEREEREAAEAAEAGVVPEDRPGNAPFEAPKPKKRALNKAQRTREQQEQHVRYLYGKLGSATKDMREGDDEARSIWIECAEALVDEFRSHKVFFPAERNKIFEGYNRSYYRKDPEQDLAGILMPQPDESIDEDIPLASIESTVPTELFGILFSAWLDIFLEYALLLANLQYEPSECYAIITVAQDCNIWYHDPDAMTQIYLCYVACALALQDENTLFSVAMRWIMREHAFCSDAYRLFATLNFYYPHNPDKGGKTGQMTNAKFRTAPNQKFLFRNILAIDNQLPASYGVGTRYGPVPEFARKDRTESAYLRRAAHGRENTTSALDRQDRDSQHLTPTTPDPEGLTIGSQPQQQSMGRITNARAFQPEEMDLILLVLYAQILYAGGSFPSALSYLYRAHSLDPKNTVVLLSISLCYMHQMFKRQNENRHMYLLQGWAIFEEYAEARLDWAKTKQSQGEMGIVHSVRREIEFNRARCMQMVGLADLAVRGYDRMMTMKKIKDENEMDVDDGEGAKKRDDYDMEAAYAMAVTYALNGDAETARGITEKWLTIE